MLAVAFAHRFANNDHRLVTRVGLLRLAVKARPNCIFPRFAAVETLTI
jgi:hypothetical protein